ncbi:MAG: cytochrome b N-terminal domain-containing protein [Bryobacteraceae bacterium]
MRTIINWLEDRTGIESAVRHFLMEDIPASSGWHQVFGSIALFLILIQACTGILLSFNYAPTPGEAYNSLKYIVTELTGGRLIRGLHHWGASMTIVIVVLHMVQVFIWGSYKKPREATWMMGVVLLLITMAFGLTGYLLPWDNRAYWGTVVTTQIAGSAPVLGQYVQRLMGAENGVGVVTFARFYSVHVLLLPPLTMILIGLHVFLVRKHGVAPAPDDFAPKKKFYPEQVFKDTVGIFLAFALLFGLAVAVQVPLGRLADPTDTSYIPRPEWYFLFLFQTLKFMEGPLEVVGSVVLPTLGVMALFVVPFIDRGKALKVTKRTTAMAAVALAAIGWSSLTLLAMKGTPETVEIAEMGPPASWQLLKPDEMAGIGFYRKEACRTCHSLGEGGTKAGPDLAKGPTRKDATWMIAHFKAPGGLMPGSAMPPIQLSDSQLSSLASFLMKVNANNAEALRTVPDAASEGAVVYQAQHCGVCHMANGVGSKMGPALNGLASRRSKEWVEGHMANPKKYSPGSTMPPYKLNAKDLDRLTAYVLSLPTDTAAGETD